MPCDESRSRAELIAELKAEREQVAQLEQGISVLWREIARSRDSVHQMQKDLDRYRAIVSSTLDGISLLDKNYRYVIVNETYERFSGMRAEELRGRTIAEYLGDEVFREDIKPYFDECLQGKVVHYQQWIDFPGYGRRYVEMSYYPYKSGQDEIYGVVANTRDITERCVIEESIRYNERMYRLLAENTVDCIWSIDLDFVFTYVNPAIYQLTGQSPEDWIGTSIDDHFEGEQLRYIREYIDEAFQRTPDDTRISFETYLLDIHGATVDVEVNGRIVLDELKNPFEIQGVTRDITRRKRTEEELLETKERFDVALQVTNTGLWDWNLQTGDVVFNEQWAAMAGYSLDELKPLNIRTWRNLCHPEDLEVSDALVKKHLAGETDIYQCEARMKHKRNGWIWILDRGKVIEWDESARPLRMIGTHTDITERKSMEERLRQMGLYDFLTGLFNRTYFEEEMRRLSDGRYLPMGIIVCDVNGLKLINDTMGHDKGDDLLRSCARILWRCFRQSDIIARIGGDEFAVLLPQSGHEAVRNGCERIRSEVSRYQEQNPEFGLSISLGFAVKDRSPMDMDALFKQADDAMYKEKLQQSHSSRSETVQALIKTLEARDYITEGHAGRLHKYAQQLGRSLGLSEERLNDLQLLARFHDLGKVGVPDRILFKPGRLTEEEFQEMKRHCEIGHRIALSLTDLAPIADYILKHHEHWDGQGYPLGLSGKDIPLECRILAIVDAYDTMTSERPYKGAVSQEDAVSELEGCAGTQFDPELVERFVRIMRVNCGD